MLLLALTPRHKVLITDLALVQSTLFLLLLPLPSIHQTNRRMATQSIRTPKHFAAPLALAMHQQIRRAGGRCRRRARVTCHVLLEVTRVLERATADVAVVLAQGGVAVGACATTASAGGSA